VYQTLIKSYMPYVSFICPSYKCKQLWNNSRSGRHIVDINHSTMECIPVSFVLGRLIAERSIKYHTYFQLPVRLSHRSVSHKLCYSYLEWTVAWIEP